MKTQSMSIKEFMHPELQVSESKMKKLECHLEKYGMVYKVAGLTVIFVTSAFGVNAFAATGIDGFDFGAEKLYKQLLRVGKWIIIFKGGFDILKHMSNGDMDQAKKSFLGYAVTYSFLWALPYIMDSIDGLFSGLMPAESPLGGK
jgi:hypothetical protein